MAFALVLPSYLIWHYTTAYTDILRLWVNYIWFFYNFFSIPLLAKTLFLPWQRISERRRVGFNFEDLAEVVMVNILMRFVGFLIRAIFIILGSVLIFVIFWMGVIFLLVWTLMPVLAPLSIFYGLSLFL